MEVERLRVEGARCERGGCLLTHLLTHELPILTRLLTHVLLLTGTYLSIAINSTGFTQAMPALLTTATRGRGTGARAARSCCT